MNISPSVAPLVLWVPFAAMADMCGVEEAIWEDARVLTVPKNSVFEYARLRSEFRWNDKKHIYAPGGGPTLEGGEGQLTIELSKGYPDSVGAVLRYFEN